jgi:hypothetical protein
MYKLLLVDIKPDNIMIDVGRQWTTEAIDTWVRENPPRTYAPERSLNKMVSASVAQSFPLPTIDALPSCNFILADFSNGNAQNDLQIILLLITSVKPIFTIQLSFRLIRPQMTSRPSVYGLLRLY